MATTRTTTKSSAVNFDQPGAQVVLITPALAEKWLERNVKNRPFKPHRIAPYARDMREDNWRYTGEPIKFDRLGALSDGQNRLKAIIEAGVTLPLLVVTGLEPDAQEVMDTGAVRNASDALALRGFVNSSKLASIARTHYLWLERGVYITAMSNSGGDMLPTVAAILQYTEGHPLFAEIAPNADKVARQLRLPVGSIGAVMHEAIGIDADDAKEFFDRVIERRNTGKGDPIGTLVKRAADMAARRERVRASTGIFLFARAWNAWRSNEYLEKFQLGGSGRGWAPIPDLK